MTGTGKRLRDFDLDGVRTTYLIRFHGPKAQLSLILAILKLFPFRYCVASDYAS
jgi:hypothetical protein